MCACVCVCVCVVACVRRTVCVCARGEIKERVRGHMLKLELKQFRWVFKKRLTNLLRSFLSYINTLGYLLARQG
jgi:hypothetical protein